MRIQSTCVHVQRFDFNSKQCYFVQWIVESAVLFSPVTGKRVVTEPFSDKCAEQCIQHNVTPWQMGSIPCNAVNTMNTISRETIFAADSRTEIVTTCLQHAYAPNVFKYCITLWTVATPVTSGRMCRALTVIWPASSDAQRKRRIHCWPTL